MEAIEIVSSTNVNGIEVFVSNDGKQTGMSITGLADLCGVSLGGMSDLTMGVNTGFGKVSPKCLEHLRGKVFHPSLKGIKGQKIVTAKASQRIIQYYAYESHAKNQTALDSLDVVGELGVHFWILYKAGFRATISEQPIEPQVAMSGMEAVVELAKRFITLQENTAQMPGLQTIMSDLSEPANKLKPAKTFLKDYLATKGIVPDKKMMSKISQIVAATYKAHRGILPEKKQFSYITPSGCKASQTVYAYDVEDYGIIDATLEHLNLI